jgi:hypothetical protein
MSKGVSGYHPHMGQNSRSSRIRRDSFECCNCVCYSRRTGRRGSRTSKDESDSHRRKEQSTGSIRSLYSLVYCKIVRCRPSRSGQGTRRTRKDAFGHRHYTPRSTHSSRS